MTQKCIGIVLSQYFLEHPGSDCQFRPLRNQANLTETLGNHLGGIIGPGPHRVGHALFFVAFAYRDEAGEL